MEEDYHKTGLYRWQRQAKPRVYSRSQKVATTDDIQEWLQKVEEASSKATEAVLGPEISSASPYTIGRQRGRDTVKGVSDQARIHDEAYSEAQDLLNEWLTQKVSLHDDLQDNDPDLMDGDPWRKEDLGSKARQEWDNLLNGNLEQLGIDTTPRLLKRQEEDDSYAHLYDLDEGEAVSMVMHTMLSKQLVKDSVRRDLGLNNVQSSHDPRTKMEMRHQRVKENRQKREEDLQRQRKEAETKKQARLTARQIVLKEQKAKELKQRKEEQEIKKQMAQIRKEMQLSRKQESEERLRKQHEAEEKARLAREEVERQEAMEREDVLRKQQESSERWKAKLAQRELEKARQTATKLRILHRHFTAWYDVVLYRRLCFGKARALADWRLSLRVWNAWRSYARCQLITMETKQHELNVVDENRKAVKAQRHHYLRQLGRYFVAWRDFVSQEQERQELVRAQETTRSKMMNLLTAVAEGVGPTEDDQRTGGGKGEGRKRGDREGVGRRHAEVAEDWNQPEPRRAWEGESTPSSCPSSRPPSSLSSASTSQCGGQGQGQRRPSQGWQITRRHAHMSKEELSAFMQGGDSHPDLEVGTEVSSEHSDVKVRRRFGTQPWMKRHYVVNNLEHRFTAQQKLLHEQQVALKEQQRMIDELVFTRQQHDHQKQLVFTRQQHDHQKQLVFTRQQHDHQKQLVQLASAHTQSAPVPATEAVPDGNGHKHGKKGDSCVPGRTVSNTSSKKMASDGGDTHRTEVCSTVSTPCGSEVTAPSSASNTKYLRVLKNMEERAAERARLKAEREEKRRKAEEERLEQLKAEEEQLKKQAEEEKQARVQAYRQKKRLEKQREQEKQRELERERELINKADDHYQKALMKFQVLLPMKKLVHMAQDKMAMALCHHNHQVLRKVLTAWKQHTDELTAEKKQLADDLHGYIVVRRCFQSWKNFKYRMVFLERRAVRHYRESTLPKLWEAWRQYTAQEMVEEQEKLRQAQDFYPRSLQRKVLCAWRRLPQELKREAEREKLRTEMRKKVADLLPDFRPDSVSHSNDFAA
ncbi:uncharacterized protein LOC143291781 isoform X2 [Babylonia areolata]|uniref:uncharacterized protein LOC143291781 isoform X2 n=1 Tax=Babylonia areolata TaxID=304850 RepID=UPI003FD61773